MLQKHTIHPPNTPIHQPHNTTQYTHTSIYTHIRSASRAINSLLRNSTAPTNPDNTSCTSWVVVVRAAAAAGGAWRPVARAERRATREEVWAAWCVRGKEVFVLSVCACDKVVCVCANYRHPLMIVSTSTPPTHTNTCTHIQHVHVPTHPHPYTHTHTPTPKDTHPKTHPHLHATYTLHHSMQSRVCTVDKCLCQLRSYCGTYPPIFQQCTHPCTEYAGYAGGVVKCLGEHLCE